MNISFPKVLRLSVIVLTVVFSCLILTKLVLYHFQLLAFPYPHEYREGAVMTTTEALVNGKNPYALKNQPAYTNDYGIMYSIVVYPLAKIFGPTLFVHRLVTGIFIFIGCAILFLALWRLQVSWLLSLPATLIFYACMILPGTTTPGAHPSAVGEVFYLLAILIPLWMRYSWKSLVISVVLGLLGIYTKPYFLLAVPIIGSYIFFFHSKKKGLAYTAMFLGLGVLSVIVVHKLMNSYFSNCYFIHANVGHIYVEHLMRQLSGYFQIHKVLIIPLVVMVVWQNRMGLVALPRGLITRVYRERFFARINFLAWDRPLFDCPVSLHFYASVCAFLALVIILGKHNAAFLWYFYHLLTPFLLIFICKVFSRSDIGKYMIMVLLCINVWAISNHFDHTKFLKSFDDWKHVEKLIQENDKILNSPVIAPLLVNHGKPVYDNGLSEYFKQGAYRYYPITAMFFPVDKRIIMRHYAYFHEIRQMVRNQAFDLLMLKENYAPFAPAEISERYQLVGTVNLLTPHIGENSKITIWTPRN